jgi:hypothetical protein
MKLTHTHSTLLFTLLLTLLVGGFTEVAVAQAAVAPAAGAPSAPTPASDPMGLTALFTLLGALSVATQKLVDIIKGFASKCFEKPTAAAGGKTLEQLTEKYEQKVHLLAAGCGIVTAACSWSAIHRLDAFKAIQNDGGWHIALVFVIGLLASGTSGTWNSINDWLKGLKKPNTP